MDRQVTIPIELLKRLKFVNESMLHLLAHNMIKEDVTILPTHDTVIEKLQENQKEILEYL